MTDNNGTPDSAFSWAKVWTTPFGLFIIGVVLLAFFGTYVVIKDRQETQIRRASFCQSEIAANQKQRMLWDGIFAITAESRVVGHVVVDGRRYEVVRTPTNDAVLDRYRKFVEDTYPIGKCPLAPGSAPVPTRGG